MNEKRFVKVTNRDSGTVSYKIPDLGNLKRTFQKGETKEDVTFEELKKLSFIPGGDYILKNCLVIHDKDAIKMLIGKVEPEYLYSKDDVQNLLLQGTLDQLKDCLDFAPEGVINMVKELAVKLEINDLAKRTAIQTATGFNVTKAIEINHAAAEEDEQQPEVKRRRATPITGESSSEDSRRRTAAPKYKIIE